MDFNNNMPIYIQIMDYIKGLLVKEKLRSGDKLMSVREMAEQFKVNPNTVQRAYQELEREGILFTKRGKGTFVTEDRDMVIKLKKEISKDIINSFIDNMKDLGFRSEEILSIISEELKGRGHDE